MVLRTQNRGYTEMDETQRTEDQIGLDAEAQERRLFLRKVWTASAAAPAVALLMAANLKVAQAQVQYGGGSGDAGGSSTGGSGSS